jgi:hypothetical protein
MACLQQLASWYCRLVWVDVYESQINLRSERRAPVVWSQFTFECKNGYYEVVYNSLSYCEAHKLSVEDEKKDCPKEVVNDPLRKLVDELDAEMSKSK